MSKFKVCTYHIKFDNANPVYENIFNLSSKINKKYCELNGYEYTNSLFDENVLKDFLTDEFFKIDKKWTKACIYKYQYLLDVLNTSENDFIVYVEYDACFCNTIKKLEEYIDNEHSIFYSRCNWSYDVTRYVNVWNQMGKFLEQNKNKLFDFYTCSDVLTSKEIKGMLQILSHPTFLNEGFFILKNNEISRKFLKCIIDYSQLFYEENDDSGWSAEGQVIGKLTSLSCFANHLKPLPPKTQGHIYGGSNRFDESECLVCHNSSIDKNILYQKMEEISKNKYWQKLV